MGIVSPYVMDLMPPHSLEADPDIGLYVFHQMANMNLAIGIWQGGGNKKAARKATHAKQA